MMMPHTIQPRRTVKLVAAIGCAATMAACGSGRSTGTVASSHRGASASHHVAADPRSQTEASTVAPGRRRGSGFGSDWTTYHGTAEATGVQATPTTLRPSRRAWISSRLDGQLYGEPLVADGRVVAASENNSVYVMAARSGRIL